jgi:hypothetical protein
MGWFVILNILYRNSLGGHATVPAKTPREPMC